MQKILREFKEFNSKHRDLIPFIVYLEIVVIVFVSMLGYLKRHIKAVAAVLLALCLVVVAVKCSSGLENRKQQGPADGAATLESVKEENAARNASEDESDNDAEVGSTAESDNAAEATSTAVSDDAAEAASTAEDVNAAESANDTKAENAAQNVREAGNDNYVAVANSVENENKGEALNATENVSATVKDNDVVSANTAVSDDADEVSNTDENVSAAINDNNVEASDTAGNTTVVKDDSDVAVANSAGNDNTGEVVKATENNSAAESDNAAEIGNTTEDVNAAESVSTAQIHNTSVGDTSVDLNEKAALLQEELSKLSLEYPETKAWIWFEDDLISQPVMQSGDNKKYADLDNTGSDSNTGAIFFDYRSKADLSDPNTIIYGHNMRDYSMFGAFKYYKNDITFLKDHKYFRIITPDAVSRYMIFAYMGVPENSEIYSICGDSADRMRWFLDTIEYRTYIDTGIEPSEDDKIVTLSTCTESDQLNFVMFAVKVEE